MSAHDTIRQATHDALCSLRIPHADHIWVSPIPFFDDVTDAIEAALSAAGYSITKTDDGAVSPPANSTGIGVPEADESANGVRSTVAVPSSHSSGGAS